MLSTGELHAGLHVTIHQATTEDEKYNDDPMAMFMGRGRNRNDLTHLMGVPLKITGVALPFIVCVYQAQGTVAGLFGTHTSMMTGHIVLDTRSYSLMEVPKEYLEGYAEALLTKQLFPADTTDGKAIQPQ